MLPRTTSSELEKFILDNLDPEMTLTQKGKGEEKEIREGS